MSRGWCGRLCPVGAFYSLLGHWARCVSRPRARRLQRLHGLLEVCPEPQVIRPAPKGEEKGVGPVIPPELLQLVAAASTSALKTCFPSACANNLASCRPPGELTGLKGVTATDRRRVSA